MFFLASLVEKQKMKENKLLTQFHGLLLQPGIAEEKGLEASFLGRVLHRPDDVKDLNSRSTLYLTGNISEWMMHPYVRAHKHILVIQELSQHDFKEDDERLISVGKVPRNVHNVGVFVPRLVPLESNLFEHIVTEHEAFQHLTLGEKPGVAYRTGAYITPVIKNKDDDSLAFHLLRCSSNFTGPTHNTTPTDVSILKQVNEVASSNFERYVELNHVLAQIYHNQTVVADDGSKKDKKAVIAAHSDKTKDMPRNGLIAFFTLYRVLTTTKKSTVDKYDYVYKNQSVLTTLRFVLKVPNENMVPRFDVTLYPNSVFIMSLGMNREYTHAIVPSILPVEHLPTRMGYVIRCSQTKAVWKSETTHIVTSDDNLVPMQPCSAEKVAQLKEIYADENRTNEVIEYPFVDFSMNQGDYMQPLF